MKHKISISRCRVRDAIMWRVRWHEAGRVHRKFFTGRDAADLHATRLRGDFVSKRAQLLNLPQGQIEQLFALAEAQAAHQARTQPDLGSVLNELINSKRAAGRDDGYLKVLGYNLNKFIKGRERMPFSQITHVDIEKFLDAHGIEYRATLRSRLATLFKFGVRRGYRTDCPTDRLETVTVTQRPPAIFTVSDVKKCLTWFKNNRLARGWFLLTTFAGLRPEEALQTSWREINFKEGWIRVEAQTTKVRQRRVVYPRPEVIAALKRAKQAKAKLPLSRKSLQRERQKLRAVLRWPTWKKDVTRHSAASYWLAACNSAVTVATALGHSESILRRHYMALVTRDQAEQFWKTIAINENRHHHHPQSRRRPVRRKRSGRSG